MIKFKTIAALGLIAGAIAPTGVNAEDRRVRIINETSHTMVRFYASNVEKRGWEEDILGDRTLRPGQSVTINIDDGSGHCMYDFKADFNDGDSLTRSRINVCNISSYRYTE